MALNISFPDINEEVSILGKDSPKDFISSENPYLSSAAKLAMRQHYNFVFAYGIGKGIFTAKEVEEHVQAHGMGFNVDRDDYSPFEEKLKALVEDKTTLEELSLSFECNTLTSFQLLGLGILFKEKMPDESESYVQRAAIQA